MALAGIEALAEVNERDLDAAVGLVYSRFILFDLNRSIIPLFVFSDSGFMRSGSKGKLTSTGDVRTSSSGILK